MPDSIVGKEFLPNVHIEEIIFQKIEDILKVKVELALYDYKNRTWSLDSKFTGYLGVNLLSCINSELISEIKQGMRTIDKEVSLKSRLRTIGFSDFDGPTNIIVESTEYVKYKTIIDIEYSPNIAHLSYFAGSTIFLQDLKDNESLNLSYGIQNYMGSVTGEDVLRNKERVEKSNLFFDDEGNRWAGPVHVHNESIYMEGSKHVDVPHSSLTLDSDVPNSKMRYLPSLSYRTDGVPVGNLEARPTSMSSIYEQGYVQDANGNVSCTFMADLYGLSIQQSRAASIMYNNDQEIFRKVSENLNIKNIEVSRYSLKPMKLFNSLNMPITKLDMANPSLIAKSFNNNKKVKEKVMYRVSSRESISIEPKDIKELSKSKVFDGKDITRDIINQGKKIGSIKQLNLSLARNIRPITFTDFEIKEIRGLEYGFSVKLQIDNDFLKYVKNLLKELTSYAYKLQNFYNTLMAKAAYDGDKFKPDFLVSYYSQYGIQISEETGTITSEIDREKLKNIFIFKAFEFLNEAERLSGLEVRSKRLLESFNLFTTNPPAINRAINYYNKTIDQFKRLYSIDNERKFGKSSVKTPRKDKPIIEKVYKLKKTYKKPMLPKIGFNFISQTKHTGLNKVKINDFSKRANVEISKFFKTTPTRNNPFLQNLSDQTKKEFVDLSTNRFKHFSPSKFFFGTKEVDTTSLNPESMQVDFFNNLKVTRALMEKSTEEEHSLNDIEEEKNLYIDSREYLGEDTKFNNTIIKTLRRNPLKISKIRKEFKLLDKSILKTKRKKLSLNTFDLSSKDNIVKKSFANNSKDVPLQIKALSMLRSDITNFDIKNLQFDPLANPQTDETIKQNFMNIGKVEFLEGFETNNGIPMLNKPIFKEITPKNFEMLKKKNVMCAINNTNFDNLTIDDSQNFQIFDKIFTLESTEEDQMDIGETQALSGDNNDMVDIFVDTVLSPTVYSSTIVTQNENNASIVEPFKESIVESTQTATVQTNIQIAQSRPSGGSY